MIKSQLDLKSFLKWSERSKYYGTWLFHDRIRSPPVFQISRDLVGYVLWAIIAPTNLEQSKWRIFSGDPPARPDFVHILNGKISDDPLRNSCFTEILARRRRAQKILVIVILTYYSKKFQTMLKSYVSNKPHFDSSRFVIFWVMYNYYFLCWFWNVMKIQTTNDHVLPVLS